MVPDPYGFEDSAPTGAAGDASRAMWFSVSAALLAAVGICGCYLPYFLALPLGVYGAYLSQRVLSAATDERDRSMATAGLVSGVMSALVSGLFVMIILLYVMIYVVLAVVFVVAAAADGGGGY